MHICHVVLSNIGGAPKVAASLIKSQSSDGAQVSVIVLCDLHPSWSVDFAPARLEILRSAGSAFHIGGPIAQIQAAWQLGTAIASLQPDLLISHATFVTKLVFLGQMFMGIGQIPNIGYVHSDYLTELVGSDTPIRTAGGHLVKWLDFMALGRAAGVVFVGQTLRARFAELGFCHPRAIVSYNPVVISQEPAVLHPLAETWLTDDRLATFVCAARFHPQKDHQTLLEAIARLYPTYPNLRLILLGDGELEPQMQAYAAQLGIKDVVLFAGCVPQTFPYFQKARAVVLPSHFEGLSLVLIEATASGTPFIASDCPGSNRELATILECGSLVPPGDVTALAGAIASQITSPIEKIDRAAQMTELFSEAGCDRRLNHLIEQILSEREPTKT